LTFPVPGFVLLGEQIFSIFSHFSGRKWRRRRKFHEILRRKTLLHIESHERRTPRAGRFREEFFFSIFMTQIRQRPDVENKMNFPREMQKFCAKSANGESRAEMKNTSEVGWWGCVGERRWSAVAIYWVSRASDGTGK
jgi:hypothetical protein